MKVLITGGSGMLGQDLVRTVPPGIEVVALGSKELDITNLELLEKLIKQVVPDRVIHCAAWTDVDGCEKDPAKAELVNYTGTCNVGTICGQLEIPICYISTDFVFDGTNNIPYNENDSTNPISVYGKTKLMGEEWIKQHLSSFFIVRTSWLFGVSGKNFVATMLRLAKENMPIKVVNDQYGSPTFTEDLARAIWSLVTGDKFGLYHVTNSGSCSWYEFAGEIFKIAGIDREILPVTTKELNRPAKRPAYSVLSNNKWHQSGFIPLRHYKEALSAYLSILKVSSISNG